MALDDDGKSNTHTPKKHNTHTNTTHDITTLLIAMTTGTSTNVTTVRRQLAANMKTSVAAACVALRIATFMLRHTFMFCFLFGLCFFR